MQIKCKDFDPYHFRSDFVLPADEFWRLHMQAVYRHFFAQWFPGEGFRRILKTDLFDEATIPFHPSLDLRQHGTTLVGLDLSRQVVFRARHHLQPGCQLAISDVRQLPFQSESFDLIFSNSTLDHFSEKAGIKISLKELARVLAPGGFLFITLDNPHNPVIGFRNRLPFRIMNALGILPFYMGATLSHDDLVRSLQENGFSVRHSTFADFSPRLLLVWYRRLFSSAQTQCTGRILRGLWRFERWCSRNCLVRLGCFIVVWAEKKGEVA